ncbi:MAG TPA: hypothetical protein VLN59_03205 [Burkholderiales bacterium]|nr:hypothetical protein [Burkholderiales bacterium]
MLQPHHWFIAPLIAMGWAVGPAYPGQGIDRVSDAGTAIAHETGAPLATTARSVWRRLEISTSATTAAEPNPLAASARLDANPQDGFPAPRPSYGWVRNEFSIGFTNQGVLGGLVRWRPGNTEAALAQPGAYTLSSDPAALASYPWQRGGPCCLPELAPPSPSDAHGVQTPGAAPMVSLVARLRAKGLDLDLPDAWKINAGVRTREYTSTLSSRMAHITVDRFWGDLRTSYSFQVERPNGWHLAPSHKLSLDYAVDPQNAVGLSFTSGREMAFFGSLGAVNTEVRALALNAEHNVHKNWSFSFSAGYFDHGAMPSQKAIRFGFRCPL